MNPLESRKQLLLAESELNRAHLAADIVLLRSGIRSLTGRVKSFGLAASFAMVLMTGLRGFKRAKPAEDMAKSSWLQTILKGAGVITTLYTAFRRHKNK
jgi:hypothetical protein